MPRKMSTFNSARVKLAAQGKKRIIAFYCDSFSHFMSLVSVSGQMSVFCIIFSITMFLIENMYQ